MGRMAYVRIVGIVRLLVCVRRVVDLCPAAGLLRMLGVARLRRRRGWMVLVMPVVPGVLDATRSSPSRAG
jgi:hypothetical protein